MEKKKVLHIVEAFGGGIFSFLVDLINETNEEFEVVIVYSKREQTPDNFKRYFNKNIKFIEVKNFTRNISPIKDIKAFFEIRNIIKEEKPQVVHLHSSKAGFIGRFATIGKNIKMLYNPHGFSFLIQNSSKIKRIIYWLIEKIATIRKCTIIGCSNGEYEEALRLTRNSICINNGINIQKLKENINQLEEKVIDFSKLKICTSGRIGFQKNPKLFNEIAASFPNIQFTWIGDGELKNELFSKNITITGWKTREETLKLVSENDIFILTSLWEGLSISLLEAMYLKKCCIATDCIGNRDVIKDRENGFIIKNKNYIDIIENLNKEVYDKITSKAKEDILKKYNTKLMAKLYIEQYR